jgi:hypothetical protein
MEDLVLERVLAVLPLAFLLLFYRFSPASKSTKVWTTIYMIALSISLYVPGTIQAFLASIRDYVVENPINAAIIAVCVLGPLKYIQTKARFARLNHIKMKYGFTDDPASYENMTIEQAQEVESNMAEVSIHPNQCLATLQNLSAN